KIDRDLTATVAKTDHEDILVAKRFPVPVFAAVQDASAKVLLAGPLWHVRHAVVATGNNHIPGAIDPCRSRRNPFLTVGSDIVDALSEARSESELLRVLLQVSDHLFAGRIAACSCGKFAKRQGRAHPVSMQVQPLVVASPTRSDRHRLFHDDAGGSELGQA